MIILQCLLILSALASLLVTGPNLSPAQSYAAGDDNGDYKITKDYKDSIYKDISPKYDSANQHTDQDNLCYKDDDCEQASEGEQVKGKDNETSGFNDQSKNAQQLPTAAGTAPSTQTGTLLVTKNVTCPDGFSCPTPSDFTMRVTGTPGNGNPSPDSFAGSDQGTTVTLNLGRYNVTEDFQDFLTRYAWGDVWTRPGLDRRTRSAITVAMLAALHHEEELAMHVRGALRNGLRREEIVEVLLQVGVYAGIPAANRAFRVAQRVLAEQP